MTALEIKEIREQLGLSQEALAERLGVHPRTIQNWESGGTIPKSKDAMLRGLTTKSHIVFGGQHVQNGDAVNGDKIVAEVAGVQESMKEVIEEEVNIKKVVACEADRLLTLLEAKQKSLDNLIAQQARFLTIIENLSKPQSND